MEQRVIVVGAGLAGSEAQQFAKLPHYLPVQLQLHLLLVQSCFLPSSYH